MSVIQFVLENWKDIAYALGSIAGGVALLLHVIPGEQPGEAALDSAAKTLTGVKKP